MCVGQYSYLRVVVCCGDYILHLGENIVYTFFGCCTYYYNLPEVARASETEGLFDFGVCFCGRRNASPTDTRTNFGRVIVFYADL